MGNKFIKTEIRLSKAVSTAGRSAKLPVSEKIIETSEVLKLCEGAFLTDPRFCTDGKKSDSLIAEYYERLVSEGARVFAAYIKDELVGINVLVRENFSRNDCGGVRENFGRNDCGGVRENFGRNDCGGVCENFSEKECCAVRNCFGVTAKKYRGTFAAAALYAGVMVKLFEEGEETLLADISEDNAASLSLHRALGGEGFSVK